MLHGGFGAVNCGARGERCMNCQFKVGAVVRIPNLSGLVLTTADPSIITVQNVGQQIVFSALKLGETQILIHAGKDFMGVWSISVVQG